jgi:phosphate/sulfate permease
MGAVELAVLIIGIALVFDYINGFHDAANSIATIVSTRVLSPGQAVLWAAFFNFVAAFLFGTAVARTVGKGFVNLDLVTPYVIMAGLAGAILWDLTTWWLALPTSSSHALIGGYAGAAVAHAGLVRGLRHSFEGLIAGQWSLTIVFIFAAPLIGLVSAYLLMIGVYWLFRHATPRKMDFYFRKLQLLSAASFSLSHGSNDAQKTMGIITGVLVASGFQKGFEIPRVGHYGRGHRHRPGNLEWWLENCAHDGSTPHAPQTAQRILRRNRRGRRGAAGHQPRVAGFHHSRHCGGDRRRRQHSASQGSALGNRHQHHVGVGAHDSDGGADRLGCIQSAAPGDRGVVYRESSAPGRACPAYGLDRHGAAATRLVISAFRPRRGHACACMS